MKIRDQNKYEVSPATTDGFFFLMLKQRRICMKCRSCGKDVSPMKRVCPECEQETGSTLIKTLDSTKRILKKIYELTKKGIIKLYELIKRGIKYATPHVKTFYSKRRNVYISLGAIATLILIIVIVGLVKKPNENVNTLSLGDPIEVASESVGTFGGTITVDLDGSPVDGMSLYVDFFSFDETQNFDISTREIKDHDFGSDFTPITPLITIDNGHIFSNYPMKLTIPITLEEDEFAMGFFFDSETGKLEAIPTESIDSDSITLLTSHFSDVVISKISIDKLKSLEGSVTSKFDTGFSPGLDDWQFINYGSYLAPGGHCAGQVLTMAYYYSEHYLKNEEPRLFGLLDNNGQESTEDFWEDDALGYRYASVVQNLLDWTDPDFVDLIDFGTDNEDWVYYAFAYAMYMTGEPQLMGIYAHDAWGEIVSGHAILAYKLENSKLYVADPNYPGQTDRFVTYTNQAFLPYSSGANAQSIINDGTLQYDQILFIGQSALIDYEQMDLLYDQVLDGSIGNDVFPTLDLLYLSTYDNNPDLQEWTDIDLEVSIDSSYNANTSCGLQDTIVIAATADESSSMVYSLYRGTERVLGPVMPELDGYVYFEIEMAIGVNDLGILAEYDDGYQLYYSDFKRIEVTYEGGVSTPCEATIIGRYDFVSRSDNQVLVTYNYIEIYANGTFKEEYQLNDGSGYISTHTGTWEVIPGANAGENTLVLTMNSISDTYLILDNYQGLSRTSGDIIFLYQKVN